jgi:hypothetical protein
MVRRANFSTRFFVITLCIMSLASNVYTLCAQEPVQNHKQEEKEREIAQIARHKMNFINDLCRLKPAQLQKPSILSAIEFDELNIAKLIGLCGAPMTDFGTAGLIWLSIPISDYPEMYRRQGIIRNLVENESSFDQLRIALHNVKKGEDALIMYWNKQSKLHAFIKDNILPQKTKKPKEDAGWITKKQYQLSDGLYGKEKDSIYRSTPGLELAAWKPFFNLVGLSFETYLAYCIWKKLAWRQSSDWTDPQMWKDTFIPGKDMAKDLFKNVFEDLWSPLNPWNRIKVENMQETYRVWDGSGDEWKPADVSVRNMGFLHAAQVAWNGSGKDRFNFGSDFVQTHFPDLSNTYPSVKTLSGLGLASVMAVRYYLYAWGYFKVCTIFKDGKKLIRRMHKLHESLIGIAKLMRGLKDMYAITLDNPAFDNSYAQKVLELYLSDESPMSPEFKELMALLQTSTFDNADSFFYSRGRVLRAHVLLKEIKNELIPLLQAVAELDGYYAITRLMKAYEYKENKFVFAEFVSHDTPYIKVQACWEPLAPTKNPVVNDIYLGAQGKPIRMIITGPNGGGKSTYLKSLAHAVTMSHSWGIVPADKAQLTMFSAVRTSLDPKEDLSAGISKFTAQKERIGNIGELMKQSTTQAKMLVILDEPYTGTTEDQMADRVHQFGVQAKEVSHTALCIATHVKKPIELANSGSFANYQIEIQEPTRGQFVRTFKVKEGAADWWFNDKPRVTRFVDWLDPVNIRKNPGPRVAQVNTGNGAHSGKSPVTSAA